MKKTFLKHASIVVLTVGCIAVPAQAQKVRSLMKISEAALSRKVISPVVRTMPGFYRSLGVEGFLVNPARPLYEYNRYFGYGNYNPVLGYKIDNVSRHPFHSEEYILAPYKGTRQMKLDDVLQVAPFVQRTAGTTDLIVSLEKASLPQLTEGIYLWRLANPTLQLEETGTLVTRARQLIREQTFYPNDKELRADLTEELPNVMFLVRLLDNDFIPETYGQLAEATKVYPKYVTLDASGFPVPTAEMERARVLDNYLMLSHPRTMKNLDPVSMQLPRTEWGYTPFVLTPEEHAAAEELLAKRYAITKIPDNPTVRQLLELAYNRLEASLVPYHWPKASKEGLVASLDYEYTTLMRKVKEVIDSPVYAVWRESTEISHLVVIDAVMGGMKFENPDALYRVLDSFEKLCREVPATPEHVAHLKILQKALLRAPGFWELSPTEGSREYFTEISNWEYTLMQERVKQFADLDVSALTRLDVSHR